MTGADASRCTRVKSLDASDNDVWGFDNHVFSAVVTNVRSLDNTAPDDLNPGDQICYGLSVRGWNTATRTKNGARHSALQCVVVGKKPKVHILGGDLYVGRDPAATGDVTTATSVFVETDGTRKTHGGWVEYGITTKGTVSGTASGAGYAGGVDTTALCAASLLTFSNTNGADSCADAAVGGYSPLPKASAIADYYTNRPTTGGLANNATPTSFASGVYRPAANSTITLGGGELAKSRAVILDARGSNIIINGDLRYTTDPLNSPSEIPQLIIIARNITINNSVGQVDAWLITQKASGVGGNIYTCEVIPANSTACSRPLTVNGPVITDELLLRRTAGAGRGPDAAAPAEVFNLRPDAYLWGASQNAGNGRIPTASIKELPPRF